jgi:protein phosphatase methylesterase 1
VAWPGLAGLVVIDAVEGVALDALEHGKRFVQARPGEFSSTSEAVRWSLSHGPLRGAFSANISVPDQLVLVAGGRVAWRTDLARTVPFWTQWFSGLSRAFLDAPCPKLLILAGVEKLDTPLAAGHMMGKYQLICLANVQAGHFVHEDAPGQTGAAVALFVNRYARQASLVGGGGGGMTAEQVIAAHTRQ